MTPRAEGRDFLGAEVKEMKPRGLDFKLSPGFWPGTVLNPFS